MAPGLDGQLRVVFTADLGTVLFSKQHEDHALAPELLVNASVVDLGEGVTGPVMGQQAPLLAGYRGAW